MNADTGTGILYIVPTPIGNMEDITMRALRVLRQTEIIACEDTRVTTGLLRRYELPHKKLLSYHTHNEAARSGQILALLLDGNDVALVSDAGTPGISDPGHILIRQAIEAGIRVEPLPGPSAVITALSACGLPTDEFLFAGFLPHKKGRQTKLRALATEPRTVVLYESPHRLLKALGELAEHFGPGRNAAVCRELTKVYEEISRGTLQELLALYTARPSVKGEIVIITEGPGR